MNIKEGNILSLQEGILVHGCNCRGVMGAGIAKQIRDKWGDVYSAYSVHRAQCSLRLGDVVSVGSRGFFSDKAVARHLHNVSGQLPEKLIVVNAMTQFDYGSDRNVQYVDYDAIFAAFARIRLLARDSGMTVHFPQIGCGLANGNWDKVSQLIQEALGPDVTSQLWLLPKNGDKAEGTSSQTSLL